MTCAVASKDANGIMPPHSVLALVERQCVDGTAIRLRASKTPEATP